MLERSPALNLKNTSTSLLLLHGTHDSAVNFGQALEIFWALKKKNAKVKLAAFPNEGHVFSKPSSLNGATTLVSDWFVEHLMAKVARNQKLHRVSLHQFRLDMAP